MLALEQAARPEAGTSQATVKGLSLVLRGLERLYLDRGLQRVPTVGQPFDPRLHEAVFTEKVPGTARGTILRELSPGYCTEQEVVHPARVSVAE